MYSQFLPFVSFLILHVFQSLWYIVTTFLWDYRHREPIYKCAPSWHKYSWNNIHKQNTKWKQKRKYGNKFAIVNGSNEFSNWFLCHPLRCTYTNYILIFHYFLFPSNSSLPTLSFSSCPIFRSHSSHSIFLLVFSEVNKKLNDVKNKARKRIEMIFII